MATPSPPCNSKESPNQFKTPPPMSEKPENFEDYDLSPPQLPIAKERSFSEALKKIKQDFKCDLQFDVVHGKTVWRKIRKKGNTDDLPQDNEGNPIFPIVPPELCRILLFLYSRKFKINVSQKTRKELVRDMMKPGRIRNTILQVIKTDGDVNLSLNEKHQAHYIRTCFTIHRYFLQVDAVGFSQDMSSLNFYLRIQNYGSCFMQAPCVAMAYLLQLCGMESASPPDGSKMIRHNFTDDQLIQYILKDSGGDSVGIFKILEKKFFDCRLSNRDPDTHLASSLAFRPHTRKSVIGQLQDGPGLISKFLVPSNFYCSPPSPDVREKFPDLDAFVKKWEDFQEEKRRQQKQQTSLEREGDDEEGEEEKEEKDVWLKMPAKLIPPGVARFTTWDQPAEFVLLDGPVDQGLVQKENELTIRWSNFLNATATEHDDKFTAVTASISEESSCGQLFSERSTSELPIDDVSAENDWSKFLWDDKDDDSSSASNESKVSGEGDDDSSCSSDESNEPGEGDEEAALHAMVLLGHRHIEEEYYWSIQNSWEGPTQIMEFSTDYFGKSEAVLYFYQTEQVRQIKPEDEWAQKNLQSLCCTAPVAESGGLERRDCENWTDDMICSPKQDQKSELDDIPGAIFFDDDLRGVGLKGAIHR